MYSVPYIENFASAVKFVAHLQNHQEAANSVRILRMPMCSSRYPQFARSFPAPLKVPIVLPNLVSVNQAFVVMDAFAELAAEGAVFPMESMEQELSDSPPIPPNLFLKFPHLRKLSLWDGRARNGVDEDEMLWRDALPRLEALHLWHCDGALVDIFRRMWSVPRSLFVIYDILTCAVISLPSLREFGTEESSELIAFIQTHGAKLSALAIAHPLVPLADADPRPSPSVLCPDIIELKLKMGLNPNQVRIA